MPVVSKIQNGFTAGELDPKLRARTDIGQYYNGAAKLRNVFVVPQGAAIRRPGLEYVAKLPSGNIQLIPFIFSETDHYLCVLTTNLMTIYKGGEVMDTVACVITDTQVGEVTFTQSYDTLLLFHRDFTPKAFIRTTETSWSTGNWVLNNVPSHNIRVTTTKVLTVVDSADSVIDFSAWADGDTNVGAKFSTSGAAFADTDVGSYIRGASGGYARITAYTDTTHIVCTILAAFTNSDAGATETTTLIAGDWSIEDLSWSATAGYPQCGTFFQGRLWLASTAAQPNTVWASKTNYETDFQSWLPQYDDSGIELTSGGGVQSEFKQLHGGQHLTLMADNGQYYVPISNAEAITPTNSSITRNSAYGTHRGLPLMEVDGNLLYVRQGGGSLIEAAYTFAQGSYINTDLSLLSSHLLNDPRAIAYRKQVNTSESDYILVVNGDGTLAVLCTLRVQNVTAWTLCQTEGKFVAVGVDGGTMYFAVDRTIGGIPTRCLEKFNYEALLDSAVVNQVDALTSDSTALTYDGVPITYRTTGVTTLTHCEHLNGETVSIVEDNTIQTSQTVVGGSITLSRAGNDIQAGLSFPIVDTDSDSIVYVETMPIEADTATGTTVGQKKRVIEATVMLNETSHCEIMKNKVTIRRIGIDPLDNPVPKRSSNITVSGLLGWADEVNISVGQTLSLPFQLLGLAYKVRI